MGINLTMKFFIIQFSVAALLMLYSFATPMSEERRAGGGGGGGGGGNELQRAVERQMPEDWMDPIWMICAEYRCKVCENGSGCCTYNDDPTNTRYRVGGESLVPAIGDPTCAYEKIPTACEHPYMMICAEYTCEVCDNGSGCCVYNDDPTNWKYCDRAPDIVPAIGDPTCVNKTIPTVNRRGM